MWLEQRIWIVRHMVGVGESRDVPRDCPMAVRQELGNVVLWLWVGCRQLIDRFRPALTQVFTLALARTGEAW